VLHAKLAIIDDVVFAGSSNLDARSFGINYELMVRLEDPRLADRGRALFAADQREAVEILQSEWRRSQDWRTRLAGFWARLVLTKIDPWVARRQLRTIS
jgi:cardiolipin synthase